MESLRSVPGGHWRVVRDAADIAERSPLWPRTLTEDESSHVFTSCVAGISSRASRCEGDYTRRDALEWLYLEAIGQPNRFRWPEQMKDASRLIAAGAMRLLGELADEEAAQ